ncbi:hypothetical protein OROGR_015027 [Orobanche gracilis]
MSRGVSELSQFVSYARSTRQKVRSSFLPKQSKLEYDSIWLIAPEQAQ